MAAARALQDKAREDLCFKCLERRGLIADLFKGVAYLRVVEGAGVLGIREEVGKRDFWRCGHWLLALSVNPSLFYSCCGQREISLRVFPHTGT